MPDAAFGSPTIGWLDIVASIPEQAAWSLMIGGLGIAGGALLRRRPKRGALT